MNGGKAFWTLLFIFTNFWLPVSFESLAQVYELFIKCITELYLPGSSVYLLWLGKARDLKKLIFSGTFWSTEVFKKARVSCRKLLMEGRKEGRIILFLKDFQGVVQKSQRKNFDHHILGKRLKTDLHCSLKVSIFFAKLPKVYIIKSYV